MNSMLVNHHLDVQVKTLKPSVAGVAPATVEAPSNGFFRGLLIGFGIMVPFWGGMTWLGLRLLHLG